MGVSWRISPPQFGVRTYPNQLQRFVVGLAVNQHQIGLHMAIAVVLLVAGQCVITVASFQWRIGRKCSQNFCEVSGQTVAMLAFALPLPIAPELPELFNRPHLGQPLKLRRCQTFALRLCALPPLPQ